MACRHYCEVNPAPEGYMWAYDFATHQYFLKETWENGCIRKREEKAKIIQELGQLLALDYNLSPYNLNRYITDIIRALKESKNSELCSIADKLQFRYKQSNDFLIDVSESFLNSIQELLHTSEYHEQRIDDLTMQIVQLNDKLEESNLEKDAIKKEVKSLKRQLTLLQGQCVKLQQKINATKLNYSKKEAQFLKRMKDMEKQIKRSKYTNQTEDGELLCIQDLFDKHIQVYNKNKMIGRKEYPEGATFLT